MEEQSAHGARVEAVEVAPVGEGSAPEVAAWVVVAAGEVGARRQRGEWVAAAVEVLAVEKVGAKAAVEAGRAVMALPASVAGSQHEVWVEAAGVVAAGPSEVAPGWVVVRQGGLARWVVAAGS